MIKIKSKYSNKITSDISSMIFLSILIPNVFLYEETKFIFSYIFLYYHYLFSDISI